MFNFLKKLFYLFVLVLIINFPRGKFLFLSKIWMLVFCVCQRIMTSRIDLYQNWRVLEIFLVNDLSVFDGH